MIYHSIDDLSTLKLKRSARLFNERKVYLPQFRELYSVELGVVQHLQHVDRDETSVNIYNILTLKTGLLHQTRQILIKDLLEVELSNIFNQMIVWRSFENVQSWEVFELLSTSIADELFFHDIFLSLWVES